MNLGNLLFSFDGRIGRGRFWLGFIIVIIVELVLDAVFGVSLNGNSSTNFARLADFVISLVLLYPIAAVAVKRLHDRAQSGRLVWWFLAALTVTSIVQVFGLYRRDQTSLLIWLPAVAAGIVQLGFLIELGFRRSREPELTIAS